MRRVSASHAPGPVCLVEHEVGGPAPQVPQRAGDGRRYARVAVAVRMHGVLLGVADLAPDGADGAGLTARAEQALQPAIDEHLRADARASCLEERERFLGRAPSASVIVATRGDEPTLEPCVESLLRLDYPDYELIVVDNGAGSASVRALVEGYPPGRSVRYVHESCPGVAVAHNTALAMARGSIVAFTDDDVTVDPLWLAQLARGFELDEGVACVTGLILPAELESGAQVWLDDYWGFAKGFERRIFDGTRPSGQPLYPYTAGVFGSGANMAFRTDALRELGGFDPALGTGSPALGGDDLAAFFDVIAGGHKLVYEPTAVVRHLHRPDYGSLRRQAYGYGVGLSAYIAKTLMDDPRRALDMGRRLPRALAYVLDPRSPKNARRPDGFPAELTWLERYGMATGAAAYLRSRRRRRALYPRAAEGSVR